MHQRSNAFSTSLRSSKPYGFALLAHPTFGRFLQSPKEIEERRRKRLFFLKEEESAKGDVKKAHQTTHF
jgi:hypothetical protein